MDLGAGEDVMGSQVMAAADLAHPLLCLMVS